MRAASCVALALVALALAACASRRAAPPAGPSAAAHAAQPSTAAQHAPGAAPAVHVAFRLADVTATSGISFRHENAAFGARYLPETMGSGVALLDFDGDGRLDVFLVDFMPWPGHAATGSPTCALYRNLGGMRFEDVTRSAGLAVPMAGMGVTVGDMDSDGDPDLFVTCLGPDHLFRNDGGRFTDVTASAGIADDDFGSSATWVDVDRDGDLDLFVANYVRWTVAGDIRCTLDGTSKSYCTPESYQGESPRLWRNDGHGRFADGTEAAGLLRTGAKSLGVVAADLDGDGWQDLVVANDTQPNLVFHGDGDGTFTEEGILSGLALDESGVARGAMGIDAADYDGSGRPSLVIGNFANEMLALYHGEGRMLFVDMAPSSSVGRASLLSLAFGCNFLDVDLDGLDDILVANGHLEPEIAKVQPQVRYEQAPLLFLNQGAGSFAEVAKEAGVDFAKPRVARGLAYGDLDGDGDLDVVMTTNGGPARVFRNDMLEARHFLRVDLRGHAPRDAYGAVVRLTAGGVTRTKYVKAGSGYLSQSERIVTFGLGSLTAVDALKVTWPSGVTTEPAIPPGGVDRTIVIEEPAS